jgi:hypothetical protein
MPKNSPYSEETKKQNNRRLQDALFFSSVLDAIDWLRAQRFLADSLAKELLESFKRLSPKKSEELESIDMSGAALGAVSTAIVESTVVKKPLHYLESSILKAVESIRAFFEKAPEILIGNIERRLSETDEGAKFLKSEGTRLKSIVTEEVMPVIHEEVVRVVEAAASPNPSVEVKSLKEQRDISVKRAAQCFAPLNPAPALQTVIDEEIDKIHDSLNLLEMTLLISALQSGRLGKQQLNEMLTRNVVVHQNPAPSAGKQMLEGAYRSQTPFDKVPRPVANRPAPDEYNINDTRLPFHKP